MGSDIGQQLGAGRRTPLVIDHRQALALLGQAQHGFGEVAAARGIDPAGAQNQVLAARLPNELLAFELGGAIHGQRCGCVVFHPGPLAAAVEHIVGAVVHQPGAQACGFFGQHAGGGGVEQACQLGFALGLVHSGVGGGVHDDLGAQRTHRFSYTLRVAEVAAVRGAVKVQRRHVA